MTAQNAMSLNRPKVDRDRMLARLWVGVILVYLTVSLILPLGVMLSKSVSTYRFDLTQFSFMISDEDGGFSGPEFAASDLNKKFDVLSDADLDTSSDGRLAATKFFPDFSFRSSVKYRVRGTTADARFLVGSTLSTGKIGLN